MCEIVRIGLSELARGELSDETARELWSIFAPTCSWDDIGGDQSVANTICEALDDLAGRSS